MKKLSWVLIALSVVCLVFAYMRGALGFPDIGVSGLGFSCGSSNLALLAIFLLLASEKKDGNS